MLSQHRRLLTILFVTLLVIGGLILIFRNPFRPKPSIAPSPRPEVSQPHQTTLEGKIICLPHRVTTGPQTLECAIGLQTSQGNFALDTNQTPELMTKLITGNQFKAEGLLTPIEYLSSDHWQKYNLQGIFSVHRAVE